MTIEHTNHTYAARNMNALPGMSMMLRGPTVPHDVDDDTGADAAAAAEAARVAAEAAAAAEAAKNKDPKISDAEAALLRDAMKHKKKATDAQAALDAANARLREFDGIDPAKIRELLAAQADAERAKAEADRVEAEKRGEYDRIVAQMKEQSEAQLSAKEAEKQTLAEQLAAAQKRVDELTVGASFANSKFLADETVLTPAKARKLYDDHFDLVDGALVGYDKPRGSKDRTPLVDTSGSHLMFEAAIEKIVRGDPDFERIGRSKLKPGASSSNADVKTTNNGEKPASGVTGVNRIAAGLKAKK